MAAPGASRGSASCDERERREDVDLVDARELRERVGGESRLRARAEHARVVDEQIDAVAGRLDERAEVLWVGDVARDRDDALETGNRALERIRSPSVDEEPPFAFDEGVDEGEAETARCAGDDAHGHPAMRPRPAGRGGRPRARS